MRFNLVKSLFIIISIVYPGMGFAMDLQELEQLNRQAVAFQKQNEKLAIVVEEYSKQTASLGKQVEEFTVSVEMLSKQSTAFQKQVNELPPLQKQVEDLAAVTANLKQANEQLFANKDALVEKLQGKLSREDCVRLLQMLEDQGQ